MFNDVLISDLTWGELVLHHSQHAVRLQADQTDRQYGGQVGLPAALVLQYKQPQPLTPPTTATKLQTFSCLMAFFRLFLERRVLQPLSSPCPILPRRPITSLQGTRERDMMERTQSNRRFRPTRLALACRGKLC